MGNSSATKRPGVQTTVPNKLPLDNKSSQNISLERLDNKSSQRSNSKSDAIHSPVVMKKHFAFSSRSVAKLQEDGQSNPLCISRKIIRSLYIFWRRNVDKCSAEQKLEIAVLIFFTMMTRSDDTFKWIFKHKKIEDVSLQFMDMITRHIRSLVDEDPLNLRLLGKVHKRYGVTLQFYESFLFALHDTLSEYFPNKYKIEIKYCLDRVFINSVRVMLGKKPLVCTTDTQSDDTSDEMATSSSTPISFTDTSALRNWNDARSMSSSSRSVWLKDLTSCIESDIGREYFFRFLEQMMCYEIVIFFKLYLEFSKSKSEEEKFMLLRQVAKTCIDINDLSPFPINISHETKQEFIKRIQMLEHKWKKQRGHLRCGSVNEPVSPLSFDDVADIPSTLTLPLVYSNSLSSNSNSNRFNFKVPIDFLDPTFLEMKRLAMQNHWRPFCSRITDVCASEGSVSATMKYFE